MIEAVSKFIVLHIGYSPIYCVFTFSASLEHACNTAGWLNHSGAVGLSSISVDHCKERRSYVQIESKYYLCTYLFLLDLKYYNALGCISKGGTEGHLPLPCYFLAPLPLPPWNFIKPFVIHVKACHPYFLKPYPLEEIPKYSTAISARTVHPVTIVPKQYMEAACLTCCSWWW